MTKSPSLSRKQAEQLLKMRRLGEEHTEKQLDIIQACKAEAEKLAAGYQQLQAACQGQMTKLLSEQTVLCNQHRRIGAEIQYLQHVVNTTKIGLLDAMVGSADTGKSSSPGGSGGGGGGGGSGRSPVAFAGPRQEAKRQRVEEALRELDVAFKHRRAELQKVCVQLTRAQQLKYQTAAMTLKSKQLSHVRDGLQLQRQFLNSVLVADEDLRSASASSFKRLSAVVETHEEEAATSMRSNTRKAPHARPIPCKRARSLQREGVYE
jgi:hypothetical protein